MKKDLETISHVFLWVLSLIGLFWAVKGCFYLMSLRSSMGNASGLIAFVLLTIGIILFTFNKLKIK